MPSSFTLDNALHRLAIYEFCLRFSGLLCMSRHHLDELEEIGGRPSFEEDGDEEDISVEMGWVTEMCARSIITGLLSLVADTEPFIVAQSGASIPECSVWRIIRAHQMIFGHVAVSRVQ